MSTQVNTKDKFPETQHFAVLVFSSIWIPGDERSISHPGHGYPAHSESSVDYIAFESEEELILWLHRNRSRSFRIIQASPVKFDETISLTFQK